VCFCSERKLFSLGLNFEAVRQILGVLFNGNENNEEEVWRLGISAEDHRSLGTSEVPLCCWRPEVERMIICSLL
jgi:hypothetical protein